ncbi:cell division protein FtsQ/DivIB [Saccharomonospora azurea]|uniref:cell division protein FtsQ/DivIB n=1 Tax=Saccharomonospora azurea TaxID=40988 RepID=UPI0002EF8194|nr:FtsQ-type POTRA domain-containing protein [Saccharomonospora azurea]
MSTTSQRGSRRSRATGTASGSPARAAREPGRRTGRASTSKPGRPQKARKPGKSGTSRASQRARGGSRRQVVQRRRILLLGVLTVVTLGYLLWFTPFLGVSTVEVVGARTVAVQAVRSAAAVPEEQPLLRVDADEVAARVRELPDIATAEVTRSLPSTLTITVTERRAVAYHDDDRGIRLVDATGVPYKRVEEPPDGLPRLELFDPGPADDVTRTVTGVLASLPDELADQVVAARADTPGAVEFDFTDDRIVRWGDAEQNTEKAQVLAVLLTREGTVYDVSSPELPTVS